MMKNRKYIMEWSFIVIKLTFDKKLFTISGIEIYVNLKRETERAVNCFYCTR